MLGLSRFVFAALLLVTACDEAPTALGIGRAPTGTPSQSPLLPVTLSRIYVPTVVPTGATSFVEMRLGQSADLDLTQTPLYLLTQTGMAPLPQTTWAQNTVLRVTGQALAPLGLHANAGEIAVVDGQLNMHAYSAWGIAPGQWSQNLVAAARGRGLYGTTIPGSLNYPLDANIAINLDPNLNTSCLSADPNLDSQNAQAQLPCPTASPNLQLSRVQPAGLDTDGGWVEVFNAGSMAVDLHGATLCIDQACAPIEAFNQDPNATLLTGILSAGANANTPDGSLDPARAVILVGPTAYTGAGAAVALRTPRLLPLSAQSEVALFAPGFDPNAAPMAALSYLRLGHAALLPLLAQAQSGEEAAWTQKGLAPPRLTGESQARKTSTAVGLDPNGWSLSSSALGTAIADPASPWTSCSMPQSPALSPDPLRIVELAQDANWRVIVQNTATKPLDTSGYTLSLGPQSFALAGLSTPLAPGATLWIELGNADKTPCSVNQDLCWLGGQASLDAGALTLSSATTPVGYVQWSTANGASEAVASGLWPSASCHVAEFAPAPAGTQPYRALRLLQGASGQSPADYFVGPPTRP